MAAAGLGKGFAEGVGSGLERVQERKAAERKAEVQAAQDSVDSFGFNNPKIMEAMPQELQPEAKRAKQDALKGVLYEPSPEMGRWLQTLGSMEREFQLSLHGRRPGGGPKLTGYAFQAYNDDTSQLKDQAELDAYEKAFRTAFDPLDGRNAVNALRKKSGTEPYRFKPAEQQTVTSPLAPGLPEQVATHRRVPPGQAPALPAAKPKGKLEVPKPPAGATEESTRVMGQKLVDGGASVDEARDALKAAGWPGLE